MKYFTTLILVFNSMLFIGSSEGSETRRVIDRSEWGARTPKERNPLKGPVPYVVIHHTWKPAACHDMPNCITAMREIQNFHMDGNGWADIGYNWLVGSDGVVYEGRGWSLLGAHSLHFNNVSIGICLIGDWTSDVPPTKQLRSAQLLIEEGVRLNHVRPDYRLVGHRQVRETECPGQALFDEIHNWSNFSVFPRSVDDLPQVFKILEEEDGSNVIPDTVK